MNCTFSLGSLGNKGKQKLRCEASQLESASKKDISQVHNLAQQFRQDFPILMSKNQNGTQVIYLDNAATSQKPLQVIDAWDKYNKEQNSNVHRGIHYLGRIATEQYEIARQKIADFIKAGHNEIIFTKNGSEAFNLVAYSWGLKNLKQGDEVILSIAEHHSNIVPWQIISQKTGAKLKYHYEELLKSDKVKFVSIVHCSNMLGSVIDPKYVVQKAHERNAKILLDCCQTMPHQQLDVKDIDADFVVGTGHKIYGPTGIGVLYGKYDLLESMDPFLGGGEMIADVFQEYSTYAAPPLRFEAGTPPIAEAITLAAACDYVNNIGIEKIREYEDFTGKYLYEQLSQVDGVTVYGPKLSSQQKRAPLASFNVDGVHSLDLATLIDEQGVCLRSGHHCTQPLHQSLDISASLRASLAFYNTQEEIDKFIEALKHSIGFFKQFS